MVFPGGDSSPTRVADASDVEILFSSENNYTLSIILARVCCPCTVWKARPQPLLQLQENNFPFFFLLITLLLVQIFRGFSWRNYLPRRKSLGDDAIHYLSLNFSFIAASLVLGPSPVCLIPGHEKCAEKLKTTKVHNHKVNTPTSGLWTALVF